jgi:hypothetical protein
MSDTAIIRPIQGDKGTEAVRSPTLEHVREYIRASKAANTLRGYQSDWRAFCAWCESHSLCPLPALPETIASYIAECRTAQGGEHPATIERHC